jgi:hypothetical protein
MDRMPAEEIVQFKRRQGDGSGLQAVQRDGQKMQIVGVRQDRDIGIAAKFRSAVQHARLAAHQQVLNAAQVQLTGRCDIFSAEQSVQSRAFAAIDRFSH